MKSPNTNGDIEKKLNQNKVTSHGAPYQCVALSLDLRGRTRGSTSDYGRRGAIMGHQLPLVITHTFEGYDLAPWCDNCPKPYCQTYGYSYSP